MNCKNFSRIAFVLTVIVFFGTADANSSDSSDSSEDVDDDGNAAIPRSLPSLAARVHYDKFTTTAAPPAPCCFPNVWQGRVWSDYGFTPIGRGEERHDSDDDKDDDGEGTQTKRGANCSRGPIVSRALSKVYVDGVNQRLAGDILEGHSKPAEAARSKWTNTSYIFSIGPQKSADLYVFDRKTRKCRHRRMSNVQWTRQCIPASALSGGQLTLGPGAGGLTVEAWMFEGCSRRADTLVATADSNTDDARKTTPGPRPKPRPKLRMRVGANLLVLPGSCVPVAIQEEGVVFYGADEDNNEIRLESQMRPNANKRRGEAFIGSAFYSDLQTAITDPSVFTVPTYCNRQPNILLFDEMEDELPPVLDRFITL